MKYLYIGLTVALYIISVFLVKVTDSVLPIIGVLTLTFGGVIILSFVNQSTITDLKKLRSGILYGSITSVVLLIILFLYIASKIQC